MKKSMIQNFKGLLNPEPILPKKRGIESKVPFIFYELNLQSDKPGIPNDFSFALQHFVFSI